jgi:uncharacterized protein HemX
LYDQAPKEPTEQPTEQPTEKAKSDDKEPEEEGGGGGALTAIVVIMLIGIAVLLGFSIKKMNKENKNKGAGEHPYGSNEVSGMNTDGLMTNDNEKE